MSKNPFHRFTTEDGTKIDVNLNSVRYFTPEGDGTRLTFQDGGSRIVAESTTTVRNRTKKTWPDQTTTTDHVEEV
jgi:hypothetical protein